MAAPAALKRCRYTVHQALKPSRRLHIQIRHCCSGPQFNIDTAAEMTCMVDACSFAYKRILPWQ
jgi:hypothetical protein